MSLAGCSLITPLDFVGEGGAPSQTGGHAGSLDPNGGTGLSMGGTAGMDEGGAPSAGTSAATSGTTGSGAVGGAGASGSGGAGSSGRAGDSGSGGSDDPGGSGGEAGQSGEAGAAGEETGGTSGAGSGGGGSGGVGATGGIGGSGGGGNGGVGGNPCLDVDFDTNPLHCGNCMTACDSDEICAQGQCVVSPCAGRCITRVIVSRVNGDYRRDPIPEKADCFEVVPLMTEETTRIVCWNFDDGQRSLAVNGDATACLTGNGAPLPAQRLNGGYCVQVGQGKPNSTTGGFVVPVDE